MKPQIKVNGKTIQNLDQVPELLKGVLEDKNKDGLPDIAEAALKMAGTGGIFNKVLINMAGKAYGSIADMSPDVQKQIQEKLAQLGKSTGGNMQLQSLLSSLMGGENGPMKISTDHPTVSVTSSAPSSNPSIPMNHMQSNKTPSITSRMVNDAPENFGMSTKKTSSPLSRAQQKQNDKYFQNAPLNPLGGVGSLVTQAKGKGGGAIFLVAFALVIGWAIYELNKNGVLEKIIQALDTL